MLLSAFLLEGTLSNWRCWCGFVCCYVHFIQRQHHEDSEVGGILFVVVFELREGKIIWIEKFVGFLFVVICAGVMRSSAKGFYFIRNFLSFSLSDYFYLQLQKFDSFS